MHRQIRSALGSCAHLLRHEHDHSPVPAPCNNSTLHSPCAQSKPPIKTLAVQTATPKTTRRSDPLNHHRKEARDWRRSIAWTPGQALSDSELPSGVRSSPQMSTSSVVVVTRYA
ncbi:hypothetical protein KC19_8G084900 [Ceratodon purpureus]|uniref:Uncharacterized protein n=1 Tax=Ceratodon purpureus TaxID=3225 RepID=A0A8T0GZ30_CERPU|nr:hypothetical protein KC19_8G084900 [Ceratodon purpureus]